MTNDFTRKFAPMSPTPLPEDDAKESRQVRRRREREAAKDANMPRPVKPHASGGGPVQWLSQPHEAPDAE